MLRGPRCGLTVRNGHCAGFSDCQISPPEQHQSSALRQGSTDVEYDVRLCYLRDNRRFHPGNVGLIDGRLIAWVFSVRDDRANAGHVDMVNKWNR